MYEISSLFTHGFKLVDVSNWHINSVSLRQQNSLPGGWSTHLLLRRRKISVWARRIVSVEDNCRNSCNVSRTMSFMLSELSVERDLNPGHQQTIRCLRCPAWWNGESHSVDLGNAERVELIHCARIWGIRSGCKGSERGNASVNVILWFRGEPWAPHADSKDLCLGTVFI